MELTHRNLCDVAVRWLKRANSNNGPACQVAVSEVASGWQGEIPDAIGFRTENGYLGSYVVEVKVSRSDFLADKKKPHRNGKTVGLGNWRFYMCPTDLIKPDELPEKFGLLYVNKRGHVKIVVSPICENFLQTREKHEQMKFESNANRESFLMIRLLARLGDPEKLNNSLKEARNGQSYYEKKYREVDKKNRELYRENNRLRVKNSKNAA